MSDDDDDYNKNRTIAYGREFEKKVGPHPPSGSDDTCLEDWREFIGRFYRASAVPHEYVDPNTGDERQCTTMTTFLFGFPHVSVLLILSSSPLSLDELVENFEQMERSLQRASEHENAAETTEESSSEVMEFSIGEDEEDDADRDPIYNDERSAEDESESESSDHDENNPDWDPMDDEDELSVECESESESSGHDEDDPDWEAMGDEDELSVECESSSELGDSDFEMEIDGRRMVLYVPRTPASAVDALEKIYSRGKPIFHAMAPAA